MYGLTKIVMIDTYLKRPTVLPVDDNTNLSGTNATGKTTTLKLIPFFYGLDQRQMVDPSKSPFIDWYLPKHSSMIVFEYVRESGPCCVIVSRHANGKKPAYRFLRSPYLVELFSSATDSGELAYLKPGDLPRHWSQLGVEHTNQIENMKDYRAIIQNDKAKLTANAPLRRLAIHYCFGKSTTSLKHVEKMTHALANQKGSMSGIKLMVADILENDEGAYMPQINPHHKNDQAIEDLGVIRDFSRKSRKINDTIKKGEDLLHNEYHINCVAAGLRVKNDELNEIISDCNKSLSSIEEESEEFQSKHDIEHGVARDEEARLNSQVKVIDNEIENINRQSNDWIDQGIEARAQRLDNLDRYEQDLRDAQKRQDRLLEGMETLEQEFASEENNLIRRHGKAKETLQKSLHEAKDARNAGVEALNAKKEKVTKDYNQSEAEVAERNQGEFAQFLTEFHNLRNAFENPTFTEEEQIAEAAAVQAASDAEYAAEPTSIALAKAQDAVLAAKQERGASEDRRRKASNAASARLEELDKLDQYLNPDDKSFLSALRKHDPDWALTTGKVIDPSLLPRRDLKPHFVEGGTNLFNWRIDLDAIAEPEFANDEQTLQGKLEKKQDEVNAAKKALELSEKDLRAASDKLLTDEKQAAEAERIHRRALDRVSSARSAQKDIRHRMHEARAERKDAAGKAFSEAKKSKAEMESRHKASILEIQEAKSAAISELMGIWADEAVSHDEKIKSIQNDIESLDTSHKQKLKQLEADRVAAFKEKGVDEAQIIAAKEAVVVARTLVEEITADRGLIQDYRSWKKNQQPRLPQLASELAEAKEALRIVTERIESRMRDYKSRMEAFSKRRTELRTIKKDAASQSSEIATKLGARLQARDWDKEVRDDPLDQMLQEMELLQLSHRELTRDVKRGIEEANQIIGKHANSQLAKAWEIIREDIAQVSNMEVDSPDLWRNLAPGLEKLVNQILPLKKEDTLGLIQALGLQLEGFYQGLANIRKKIAGQSSMLSTVIGENMVFEAITDLKVRLRSRIEDLDYWEQLQRFHDYWVEWAEEGHSDLPSEGLERSLGECLSLLKGAKITGGIESLFDLEIEMKDKGRPVVVRNDQQLVSVSSEGMAYLTMCSIYLGMTRKLCPDLDIKIHWPLDELGKLHVENIDLLFEILREHSIVVVGGCPSPEIHLLRQFTHRRCFDKEKGLIQVEVERSELDELLEGELEAATYE